MHEYQRDRIHAVTQTRRPRTIVEYVSQMRSAAAAANFITLHSQTLLSHNDAVD